MELCLKNLCNTRIARCHKFTLIPKVSLPTDMAFGGGEKETLGKRLPQLALSQQGRNAGNVYNVDRLRAKTLHLESTRQAMCSQLTEENFKMRVGQTKFIKYIKCTLTGVVTAPFLFDQRRLIVT